MFKKIKQIKITEIIENAEKYYKQYEDLYTNPKQDVSTIKDLVKIMNYMLDIKAHFEYLKINHEKEAVNKIADAFDKYNITNIEFLLLKLIPLNFANIPLRTLNKIIHTEIRYKRMLNHENILPLIEERKFKTSSIKDTVAVVVSICAFLVALAAILIQIISFFTA